MLVGDWPHQGPLQYNNKVFAFEKSHKPSNAMAPNCDSSTSAMVKVSDFCNDSVVHGILTALGIMPLAAQSGVRESTKSASSSPKSRCSMNFNSSSSPIVSTPGAMVIG